MDFINCGKLFFDIGHGMGAFNWTVGEICASESFWPDVISTDIHCFTHEGPAYDMPTVMSKLLHIGMPLEAPVFLVALIGKAQELVYIPENSFWNTTASTDPSP